MKTEVQMQRSILGLKVRQKHKSGFFNLPDLESVGNKYRLDNGMKVKHVVDYFKAPSSKEFISELINEYGQIQTGGRGRGHEKWVHPYLFIDIALWYSPKLKVKVYQWIYDNLTVFRDNSGDSFKLMAKSIMENFNDIGKSAVILPDVARRVYEAVGVSGVDKWEKATRDQLKMRDSLQTAITVLSYKCKNIDEVFDIALQVVKS